MLVFLQHGNLFQLQSFCQTGIDSAAGQIIIGMRRNGVLVYLADRASDDGTAAFPKIETIVNVTELSERTVRSTSVS